MLGMAHGEPVAREVELARWYVVNDTVMGGVSSSGLERTDRGSILFSGELSLENNGGFTSTRGEVTGADWRGYSQLRMALVGDGRSYLATIRLRDVAGGRIYYRQAFDTVKGEPMEVVLVLSDFEAYAFGTRVRRAPSLETQLYRVGTVGVMLADKKPGAFALEIQGLKLEGEAGQDVASKDKVWVLQTFEAALLEGVPLFNSGRPGACAAVYQGAIERVLALDASPLDAPLKKVLASGLSQAQEDAGDEARAWTLRGAIDQVMRTLAP